jgi:hypothetical protein
MGLTIHWSLKARGSEKKARQLIEGLRQTALDLPVISVGAVVDLSGPACEWEPRPREDPLRWLLIQATEDIEIDRREYAPGCYSSRSVQVLPQRVIAFEVEIGEGSEPANFGLCKFPAKVLVGGRSIATKLRGWSWRSFCKTQYASNPDCGGVPNFLQCHCSVIALLDEAKRLGVLEHVSDEGDFWQKRDVAALAQEVGEWNHHLAALVGGLNDGFAGKGASEIAKFPNFEHLEAGGKLPPNFDALKKVLARVLAPSRPEGAA